MASAAPPVASTEIPGKFISKLFNLEQTPNDQ